MRTPEWLRSQDIDNPGREKTNWWMVLLLSIGVLGIVTFVVFLISDFKKDEVEKIPEKTTNVWREPDIKFDNEAQAAEVVTETAKTEKHAEEEVEEKEEDPRIEILAKLGHERIEPFKMDLNRVTEYQEFASANGAGGGCDILPGDIAKLRVRSAVNTDNGGVVTAILAEPILGIDGCTALEMGAVFTGMVDSGVEFGQRRANIKFMTITTTDGRVIETDSIAGDAMGSGGVPGKVNRHMASKFAGVAVATAVDLAGFALAGGGNGLGIFVGNAGSVMDDFARQFVNRKDTITVDPTQQSALITVTFTQKVSP